MLSDRNVRPFVGLLAGLFVIATLSVALVGCNGGSGSGGGTTAGGATEPPYYTLVDDRVVVTDVDGIEMAVKLSLRIPSTAEKKQRFNESRVVVSYQAKPSFRIFYVQLNDENIPRKKD